MNSGILGSRPPCVALSWTVLRGGGGGRGEAGDRPLLSPSCSLDLLCIGKAKIMTLEQRKSFCRCLCVSKKFITSGMGVSK
jgi:hypothetical protein